MSAPLVPSPTLPLLRELEVEGGTVGEWARRLYGPSLVFDGALPQGWVDTFEAVTGFCPVGQFVWGYPPGYLLGVPLPLTQEAERALAEFLARCQPSPRKRLC